MSFPSRESGSPALEARVTALEAELGEIKQLLTNTSPAQNRWWLRVAGSFENDPTFDEAVRLGQEWRKSAE